MKSIDSNVACELISLCATVARHRIAFLSNETATLIAECVLHAYQTVRASLVQIGQELARRQYNAD